MQDTLIIKELMFSRCPGEKGAPHPGRSLGECGLCPLTLKPWCCISRPSHGIHRLLKIHIFLKNMQAIQTLKE